MSNFISIPVTGKDNFIINSNTVVTCIRTSSTTTIVVIEGGTSSASATDQIEVIHAADTVADSVAKSIMDGVVNSFSYAPQTGVVRNVDSPQAISAVEFAGVTNPINIYNNDGTIGSNRIATISDTLTWTGGVIKRITNSTNIMEVAQASDFPATLVANTTYIVRGTITLSTPISVTNSGCAIIGLDRNKDKLIWDGAAATTAITITNVDFDLAGIGLSSNNTGSTIISADNYNASGYNSGRLKVLTITNCQFRNCYDIAFIEGFDLVDISNTLFWYIQAPNFGIKFLNTSKIEITSCEFIRWFDETTIPTPSGYATCPMIEILPNGGGSGLGAVNVNSSIFHPQQTQDGIKIDATSTTGFGTISSNTFVTVGLTTGLVANFSYDTQTSYIIQANQGISNGNAYATMVLNSNSVYLDNSVTNPIIFKTASTVGGGGFTTPISFPISQRTINTVADGSITYNSKIDANFIVIVTATVQQSGNGTITMRLRNNGVAITSSIGATEIKSGVADLLSFSVIGQATQGDIFDVEVESSGAADVLVSDFSLNGYQF